MVIDCVVLYICFNDTATTEIYTYGHTLSLHDALPISILGIDLHKIGKLFATWVAPRGPEINEQRTLALFTQNRLQRFGVDRRHDDRLLRFRGPRSEEHTSELQSLMRISYAVFCLNKNKLH